MNPRQTGFCAIILILVTISVSRATVVTFEISGCVDIVKDTNHVLDSSVALNTPFSASYTVETNTVPSYATPTFCRYDGSVMGFELFLGSYRTNGPGVFNSTLVRDTEAGEDQLSLIAEPRPFAGQIVTISQLLIDMDGNVFSELSIPHSSPPLAEFEERSFALYNGSGSLAIRGVITSLTPEPSALALLAVGSAAALLRRRLLRPR